jgi:hypothetical protein
VKKVDQLSLLTGVVLIAAAFAAHPNVSQSDEPPAQSSATAGQPAAAPAASSNAAGTTGTSAGKTDKGVVVSKPGRKVLVDDTLNDAQLKQVLAKGYRPEGQARGNEVYYCRSEAELGSRFQTKVCRTGTKILQLEAQGKEATTVVERVGDSKMGN